MSRLKLHIVLAVMLVGVVAVSGAGRVAAQGQAKETIETRTYGMVPVGPYRVLADGSSELLERLAGEARRILNAAGTGTRNDAPYILLVGASVSDPSSKPPPRFGASGQGGVGKADREVMFQLAIPLRPPAGGRKEDLRRHEVTLTLQRTGGGQIWESRAFVLSYQDRFVASRALLSSLLDLLIAANRS